MISGRAQRTSSEKSHSAALSDHTQTKSEKIAHHPALYYLLTTNTTTPNTAPQEHITYKQTSRFACPQQTGNWQREREKGRQMQEARAKSQKRSGVPCRLCCTLYTAAVCMAALVFRRTEEWVPPITRSCTTAAAIPRPRPPATPPPPAVGPSSVGCRTPGK